MKKCKCPEGSPFHWWEDGSSISRNLHLTTVISASSATAVERARKAGREPGRISGMSDKSDAQIAMFGDLEKILLKR